MAESLALGAVLGRIIGADLNGENVHEMWYIAPYASNREVS